MIFFSPAKLNLYLHIQARRDDGYHLLETQFCLLDFGDELVIEPNQNKGVRRRGNEHIPLEQDLAVRAVRALEQHCGRRFDVDIELTKNIPYGAGLGGGSSNAATTLKALNQLFDLGLSGSTLERVGLGLGADVPVFVRGYHAYASGVGELLQPTLLPTQHFVVICPPVVALTAKVFAQFDLTGGGDSQTIRAPSGHTNDLEAAAIRLYPDIGLALRYLPEGNARMSGSGSAVFASFDTRAQALAWSQNLPNTLTTVVCATRSEANPPD